MFLFLLLTALFFQLRLQLKLIYTIQLLLQLQLTEGTLVSCLTASPAMFMAHGYMHRQAEEYGIGVYILTE